MLNRGTQKEGRARKEGLLKSYPQSNGLFTYCRVKDGQEINHITQRINMGLDESNRQGHAQCLRFTH